MRHYRYRPGKNLLMGLFMGVMAVVCLLAWSAKGGFLAGGGVLLFGVCAVFGLKLALSSEPALSFDARGVTMRSTLKKAELAWSDVLDVSVKVITLRYWGIIPISKQSILTIHYQGGVFGSRKIHLSLGTIELPAGGVGGLLDELNAARVAAVGVAGVVMAGADEQGRGAARARQAAVAAEAATPASDFDPDAAIARYLAQKAAAPQEPGPAALQAGPPRATFGRRVA